MKKNILLLFAMLVSLTASAQKHPFVANTQQYGQLASVLGDEAYLIDSLVVVGPINEADFTTMRDCMYEGALEVVNLEKAELENKAIPECAFYDERGYPDVKLRNIIFPDNLERIGSLALYFAKLKTLKLPSSLREIDPWALCHLDSLRMDELVIPDNVEFLGGVSLAYIQGVKKLILPKKLKKIQPFTFQYSRFESIVLPEELEEIEFEGFAACRSLRKLVIPNTCKKIGTKAFEWCDTLREITWSAGANKIPDHAFSCCFKLEKINIPIGVDTIGPDAFSVCYSLKHITLPEGLECIENYALNSPSLESITLPSTVKTLGAKCFPETLKKVVSMASVPPECVFDNSGDGPFNPHMSNIIPLYIPVGTKQAYMEAKGWNQFYNIIDNVVTGIDGVQAGDGGDVVISAGNGRIALAGTSATTPYHVYDASGREVATGTIGTATEVSCKPGMYIVRAGGTVKKVFVGR